MLWKKKWLTKLTILTRKEKKLYSNGPLKKIVDGLNCAHD